jgi:hypothetical protein
MSDPQFTDIQVDPSLVQPQAGDVNFDPATLQTTPAWQQVVQGALGQGQGGTNSAIAGWSGVGSGIIGLIQAYNLNKAGQQASAGANPFGPYRAGYANQLQQLMANPGAVFNDPGYQAAFGQGVQAVERSAAAKGFLGSGNEATALMQFGQQFGMQYMTQQEQFLAGLAGANINPNYAPGLNAQAAASGITSSALGSLGYGMTRFGGAPAGTPGAMSSGGFSSAGGEAAAGLGMAGKAIGLYEAGAKALGTTAPGWMKSAGGLVGDATAALGIYSGLQRGGVAGYGQAALGAYKLASDLGAFGSAAGTASTAATAASTGTGTGAAAAGASSTPLAISGLGAGLALYNFGENWQSGDTGGDTVRGAEAGASVGTMILPGIGTIVGGLIGGAVGAVSSAFGGGKPDPETENWNSIAPKLAQNPSVAGQLSPAQNFQLLAGVMDAKNNSPGHSTNLELVFGRMGEGKLMSQMAQQINSAVASGQIAPTASASDIYSQVVTPWLKQIGAYVPQDAIVSSSGQRNNGSIDAVLTGLIGSWQSGLLNAGTPVGIDGQVINGLPSYSGMRSPVSQLPVMTSPVSQLQTTMWGGPNVATPNLQLRALGA